MYSNTESLAERLAAVKIDETHFKSKQLPIKAGNALPIAYGGFCIGFAVNAATATVPEGRHLYSILGQFLGPVSIEDHITCEVSSHRETRSFSSRQVRVFQQQPDGKNRMCLMILMDFRTLEPALLEYAPAPSMQYTEAEQCPTTQQIQDSLIARGEMTERGAKAFAQFMGPLQAFFETRQCPEGISAQNLTGIAKKLKTTQEHLPTTEKTSAEWVRCHKYDTPAASRFGNVGFMMDAGLSFLPLVHEHLFFDDTGACSTLEFAIRIWHPTPDLTTWHLRERKTINANGGLTYSEGRLWSQDKKTLVASMTQQCILRPRPVRPKKASL
ncbi:hypothetical protein AMS68_006131 [Peltaster fructicola]|uniref:Acyl-CoA thioesterase II n=1 Tax=Peltaster fructicola TaxID=286661 RepID=A0A6H0Y0T0_9PEZI|nr:hypothetical protein AMS68_006131 [Peltaster fructicola]